MQFVPITLKNHSPQKNPKIWKISNYEESCVKKYINLAKAGQKNQWKFFGQKSNVAILALNQTQG